MHHYGVFRRLLGCGAGEDEAMTRWGEIKCPRCKEADALVQAAVAAALREAINRVSGCDRISEVQPAILALIREGGE
jgi:phage FluMu protein Com